MVLRRPIELAGIVGMWSEGHLAEYPSFRKWSSQVSAANHESVPCRLNRVPPIAQSEAMVYTLRV
jgi:hypothetical protein